MQVRVLSDPPLTQGEHMWNILKIVKKGDYLYAVVPDHPKATKNGYVLEHRIVMENHLGRSLSNEEIVHHIDGNKHNNHISNLEVMSIVEHGKHHAVYGRKMRTICCSYCGKEFTREARRLFSKKSPVCSRRCNGLNNQKNLKKK